jgi:uncharacterized protein (DUF1697 family)
MAPSKKRAPRRKPPARKTTPARTRSAAAGTGSGTPFVVLLRAINVGGTGKLAMADLVNLCDKAGFSDAKTYIQSGNVVFKSSASEAHVKRVLEQAVATKLGKAAGVLVRTASELTRVLANNPFKSAPPNRVLVLFLDKAPPKTTLANVEAPGGEQLALQGRELFLHFPKGMGRSRLKIPLAGVGTARNINTVTKLAAMARAL